MNTDAHEGSLPPAGAFVTLDSDRAVLSGVKTAERSDALVVRLYNPADAATKAVVGLGSGVGTIDSCSLVDFMERPLQGAKASVADGRATVEIPAHGISTLLIGITKR